MTEVRTMKRGVLIAPQTVEIQTVGVPSPGPGEVLVRVRSCAICTWEQRTYTGVDPRAYPLLGGHEIGGVVEEIGSGVFNNVEVGDHVAVAGLLRCGQCYSCRRGYNNLCDNLGSLRREEGEPWGPGGFGDYLVAQDYQVYRVDKSLTFQEAALSEPLACVLRSIKRANVQPADTVVIVGGGIMGLLHLLLVRGTGAMTIVSEIDEQRAGKALSLGADHVINPSNQDYVKHVKELTAGRGAETTFMAVGVPQALEAALEATAKNGQVQVYASIHPRDSTITVNPNIFHDREITLTGTVSQTPEDFHQSAEMLSNRLIDVSPLITMQYPLDELEQALKSATRTDTYRVTVDM